MPGAIVEKLNRAAVTAMAKPEVKEALDKAGVEAQSSTPAAFATLIHADLEKWTRVIRAAGIEPQ